MSEPCRLTGALTPAASVVGELSGAAGLSGTIERSGKAVYFDGPYEITPMVDAQRFATSGKTMLNDLTVREVPYYETSNIYGNTVYIASEV